MLTIVAFLLAVITSVRGENIPFKVPTDREVICKNSPRGFFCSADTFGVRSCNQAGGPITSDKSCGRNQVCGCGVLRKCSEFEETCIEQVRVPQLPSSFAARFSGRRNISSPGGFMRYETKGLLYESEVDMKRRLRTKLTDENGKVRTKELITLPDPKGVGVITYLYTETSDGKKFCSVESRDQIFQRYFTALLDFSVSQDVLEGKQGNLRWIYRRGPLFPIGGFVERKWVLERTKRRNSRLFFPSTESTVVNRGPIGKTIIKTDLRFRLFYTGTIPQVRFNLPKECLNLNKSTM